ncbi:unnamed protein product [Pleuronectes platessa]|uniref:Uncharacterized protein n=1 Tax=Pleuronectes platessa TaxID=8262 RepID=A0A9N7Z1S6_PLEPL|nr:unnamed protein product [Pleuronectes platessa]
MNEWLFEDEPLPASLLNLNLNPLQLASDHSSPSRSGVKLIVAPESQCSSNMTDSPRAQGPLQAEKLANVKDKPVAPAMREAGEFMFPTRSFHETTFCQTETLCMFDKGRQEQNGPIETRRGRQDLKQLCDNRVMRQNQARSEQSAGDSSSTPALESATGWIMTPQISSHRPVSFPRPRRRPGRHRP